MMMHWIITIAKIACVLYLLYTIHSLKIRVDHHKAMFDDVWRELLEKRNRM